MSLPLQDVEVDLIIGEVEELTEKMPMIESFNLIQELQGRLELLARAIRKEFQHG